MNEFNIKYFGGRQISERDKILKATIRNGQNPERTKILKARIPNCLYPERDEIIRRVMYGIICQNTKKIPLLPARAGTIVGIDVTFLKIRNTGFRNLVLSGFWCKKF